MRWRITSVAPLLFVSGACALVYQVAWLREMRLVFGASTAASAAVLAIFMGGLGLGGAWLGGRADTHPRPLALYARLEIGIALSAAVTPLLIWLARAVYVSIGGSVELGATVATIVRLVLSVIVLGTPTVLMGGTLPAAAKAVETDDDIKRRYVALLYGTNALGAVTGAFVSTFFLIEAFGTRRTLWLACVVNLLVAGVARSLAGARTELWPRAAASERPVPAAAATGASAPPAFVYAAALTVGFAFLLMELVWYRMLAPLLGGSSFTFGLILAVALLGVGLGGVAYALLDRRRPPTLYAFALTCTLEAACMALPYALGDRIAILTTFLRSLGGFGFYGLVLGWTGVVALVVFPAAVVAGLQFPMLIALLGRGREQIGRHVGLAYAWNTVGAILGSLAGGLGLLPALSATGTWRGVVIVLVALGVSALVLGRRTDRRLSPLLPAAVTAVVALSGVLQTAGPTAAWRHSAIGAGRVTFSNATPNTLQEWMNGRRRAVTWSADGVESSVALHGANGYTFLINGKSDGNAIGDAATQVMGGLIAAILHPNPQRALVIGLGTGSTAGWLAAIPSMQRVDVVELEPSVLEVAKVCAPVNQDVLANPKVHLLIGDAREVLLTTSERYDIIFSEPSNPYRAGVSSLFTEEFYRVVAARLTARGLFAQWLQAYEVDSRTVRGAYATLTAVFPVVETWQTREIDLLLVGAMQPITYDVARLRARVQEEPFRTALAASWRTASLEGFLAHYVANASLATRIATQDGSLPNTDDRPLIEFAFARSVGRSLFETAELRDAARARNEHRPALTGGVVDWDRVDDERTAFVASQGTRPTIEPYFSVAQRYRSFAQQLYVDDQLKAVLANWRAQSAAPQGPTELAIVAEALADSGHDEALPYIEQLRAFQPAEADAALALLRWRQGRVGDVTSALEAAFRRHQHDPWPSPTVMSRAINVATYVAASNANAAARLFDVLKTPFAAAALDEERRKARLQIATHLNFKAVCEDVIVPSEPNVPWQEDVLESRVRCYELTGNAALPRARRDLEVFRENAAEPFDPPA